MLARVARAGLARDAEVDEAQRKRHGVVHTPPRLASFVARMVDDALRELGRAGLADPDVAIVDPASGPGVFLAAARAFCALPGQQSFGFALPRPRVALGLDLDPRAIEVARANLSDDWPLRLEAKDTLASLDVLRDHELEGATVAILGNPPWAGRSDNRGSPLLERLLEDFRRDGEGRALRERKIGVLSDAYVRFWRWSCELARRAPGGAVVALVTNASFLDGPVHRGMRAAMARWFSRIDVLDLGGSALIARRGDRDENLFAVRPAAALTLAVRPAGHEERPGALVRFARLRGSREEKLARLEEADSFDALSPEPLLDPVRWVPMPKVDARYFGWPALSELMPFHREGLQSNRDAFCVDADRARLLERLRAFASGEPGPWPARADVKSTHYDPERARAAIRDVFAQDPEAEKHVVRIAYRPRDVRWAALISGLWHRTRPDLLAAMQKSELALVTVRKDRGERPWTHFGVVRHPLDNCFLSARSSCRARAFPTHRPDGEPNVDSVVLAAWASELVAPPSPAELLRYVLAILASPSYRARFDSALRADYPRIPPPASEEAFRAGVAAGAELEAAFVGEDTAPASEPITIGHHEIDAAHAGCFADAIRACERVALDVLGPADSSPEAR